MIEQQQSLMEAIEQREFLEWFKKDCEQGAENLKAYEEELAQRGVKWTEEKG